MEFDLPQVSAPRCAPDRAPLLPPLPAGAYLLAAVELTAADLTLLGEQDVVRHPAGGLLLRVGAWRSLEMHRADDAVEVQPLPAAVAAPARAGLLLARSTDGHAARLSAAAQTGHALALELPDGPWVPALCFDPPHRTDQLVLDGHASGQVRLRAEPVADLAALEPALQAADVRYGALLRLSARPRLQPIAGRTLPGGVQLHVVQTGRGARELYARATSGTWYQLLT